TDGRPAAGTHLARRARRAHLGRYVGDSATYYFAGAAASVRGLEHDPPKPGSGFEKRSRPNEKMTMHKLERLPRPKSIAVFGGAQAAAVVAQSIKMGFAGEIWPVHPTKDEVAGRKAYRSVA